MSTVSPQGYLYGEDPKSSNPFWADEETEEAINKVTFSATADQTTGEASVDVTKDGYNVNFSFSGIKGETGATGPQGETGATGATGPQGEAGKDGESPTVVSTGATGSGAEAGTITGVDGTIITVYNGAQGEKGETGATGPAGSTEGLVSNVTVTNENGIYTISQTKDDTTTEVGTIEVPDVDTTNVLAEVVDSITENADAGYDYHALTETEYNGTQNNVGSLYLARNQITALNSDGSFTTVNQSGETGTGQIDFPSSSGLSFSRVGTYFADGTTTTTPTAGHMYDVWFRLLISMTGAGISKNTPISALAHYSSSGTTADMYGYQHIILLDNAFAEITITSLNFPSIDVQVDIYGDGLDVTGTTVSIPAYTITDLGAFTS